jgi:exonuclease III
VATFNGIFIVNIYAHSGAGRKTERENFFNVDVQRLLMSPAITMLHAGDFNCILQNTDCTGTPSISRALRNLIAGMRIHYTWNANTEPRRYTHYTATGAKRLDRIYVTNDLLRNKQINRNSNPSVYGSPRSDITHQMSNGYNHNGAGFLENKHDVIEG